MHQGAPGLGASARPQAAGPRKPLWRDRTWTLAGIGLGEAALAFLLGYPDAGWGALAGTPVGVANHWLTRLAVARWERRGSGGAAWVMGASMGRLALAGAALWWASGRGAAFLVGVLAGLLVDLADHALRMPAALRRLGRG